MRQAFTIALRQGNTWVLECHGDAGEVQQVRVSLSDENVTRLSSSLRGGGLNQEESRIAAAVTQMVNARTRGQREDFEISNEEVDEHLAMAIKV
jgi:hypothetical protein